MGSRLVARHERRNDSSPLNAAPPRPLIAAAAIAERVAALGDEIAGQLPAGEVVVIGVLRGAFIFMADLVRAIPRELRCDFLGVRSYGDATLSSGVVEITSDLLLPIEGAHVLLVEDIVDTGLTLKYLVDILSARKPASLRICALLSKPSRRRVDVKVDFVGFEVPDRFVVGYGLDAAQRWRHLPYIAVVE
jgi:hypoxanthine phosphoribosyltransferase